MNPIFKKLVDEYHEWLKGRVTISEIDGVCEITTPFLDRHNDRLQIYVEQEGDGFKLSDDSYILSDLVASGCSISTPHRKTLLESITRSFGVTVEGDELVNHATEKDFPRKKHLLVQAMLAVNDMFMTAKRHVESLFIEDVKAFLEKHNVRYSPDVEFTGKSGFKHRFDYLIPKSSSQPERLIKAINQPSKSEITSLLFAWTDTKSERPPKATAVAILNDENELTRVSKDIIGSLKSYGITSILWSHREEFAPALAS